jgi:NitT/TauT family transport system permease protein
MTSTAYPALATARRLPNVWDGFAILCVFGALIAVGHVAPGTWVPLSAPNATTITLDPWNLPNYAIRTTMRMFAALIASLLFTFTYATAAAKSRRAGLVLIPILDILQSVPILGFLTFTVVFFMGLFPGQVMGLELAAIFAIFTSQAWNMAFSMYQSLKTVPHDLEECSYSFHLSPWQRFWRLEVPFAMPGLVWNTMMSMSGGWFFVVASEAISVGDNNWSLPGIGSYVAMALDKRDIMAVFYAIFAMLVVILAYDQLLFRPLVAWSAKFRFETTAGTTADDPWMLKLIRRTRLLGAIGDGVARIFNTLSGLRLSVARSSPAAMRKEPSRLVDALFLIVMAAALALAIWRIAEFVSTGLSWWDVGQAVLLGFYTMLRVIVLMIVASLIWVPIGVWLGLRPIWARRAQPLAQFGQPAVPALRRVHRLFPPQPGYLADAADGAGHPVVHPVQRHRRRGGVPRRSARGGGEFPRRRLAVVAQGDHPWNPALLRHRCDHGVGRFVECGHRRRGGVLGRYEADGARAGRLHCRRHHRRQHGQGGSGRRRHVGLRDPV